MEKKVYHLDIAKITEEMHIDEYIDRADLARQIVDFLGARDADWIFIEILRLTAEHGKEN